MLYEVITEHLGEGPEHDHVFKRPESGEHGVIVDGVAEIGVGLVHHQEGLLGQGHGQGDDLRGRDGVARGVVRVGHEDQGGVLVHLPQELLEISYNFV